VPIRTGALESFVDLHQLRSEGIVYFLERSDPKRGNRELPSKMKTLITIAVLTALIGNVSMANAQTNGTSKNTSIYVAGKGKYCKESRAGSLDCFYASLDACQRHNNSSNLPCVPNPNSGT
jgi:hypothetical protein